MKKILGYALLCSLTLIGTAQAETTQTTEAPSKTYIGISLGSTSSTYLKDELAGLIPEHAIDTKDVGGKLFLGIRTDSPYFDAQFSLVNLGKFDVQWYEYEYLSGDSTSFDGSIKASGLFANGLLKLPFASNKGALYGKLGLGYAIVKQEATGEDISGGVTTYYASQSQTDTGLGFVAGFGISYDLGKHFGLQAEAERYFVPIKDDSNSDDTSTMKINLVTLGVYYRF